jgi:ABC-type branched-subunit amino acid transport system ATPase component
MMWRISMKIVMLSGPGNCGKTTVLNMVYDKIVATPDQIISQKSALGGTVKKDFECIVAYANKKIAIYTMGDYSDKVISAMANYSKLNVDILIIACNENLKKPYKRICKYEHIIIKKIENGIKKEDENICNEIISALKTMAIKKALSAIF